MNLRDILSEEQLNCIMCQRSKPGFQLLKYQLQSATEGMSGFLGDHFKLVLHVQEADLVKKIHLFVKTVPHANAPKAQFIDEHHFFQRESLTYEIMEKFPDVEFSGLSPWGVKALVHNHNVLVLPDLSIEGYRTYPVKEYLDLNHVLVALTSIARFHAAFAKYQTQMIEANSRYKLPAEYKLYSYEEDAQFSAQSGWLRAAIKTTATFLKEFSTKTDQYPIALEESITKWCREASRSVRGHETTVNVIIHKDLWANNILFKYSGDDPANAVLVDYQCTRYGPPAVDVMAFLYNTTSREFRERYEGEVLDHYFSVFSESVDAPTTVRLQGLSYDRPTFARWCERLRPAGMLIPLTIYPFILMSPHAAQEAFDDPQTFHRHVMEDRCRPVLEFARENEYYKNRVLAISEEFVERHMLRE